MSKDQLIVLVIAFRDLDDDGLLFEGPVSVEDAVWNYHHIRFILRGLVVLRLLLILVHVFKHLDR